MRLFLAGFGRVGRALAEIITRNNLPYKVVGIADTSGVVIGENIDLNQAIIIKEKTGKISALRDAIEGLSVNEAMDLIDFDILIEVTPTNVDNGEPGITFIRNALKKGYHVVTSNKGPLALYYDELMRLSKLHSVFIRYEGTVGASLPIFIMKDKYLKLNEVLIIEGVLNTTTTFILSQIEQGSSFNESLRIAQEKGYAEDNPRLDVEGYDLACKAVILANSFFFKNITLEDIEFTGIQNLDEEQIRETYNKGKVMRLSINISKNDVKIGLKTYEKTSIFAVSNNLNVIQFNLKYANPLILIGPGAGCFETAYAIISDINIIREQSYQKY
ncbi:MAG: homoserine dehydrogenase [Candidatus Asgardarchaeia archaeon]